MLLKQLKNTRFIIQMQERIIFDGDIKSIQIRLVILDAFMRKPDRLKSNVSGFLGNLSVWFFRHSRNGKPTDTGKLIWEAIIRYQEEFLSQRAELNLPTFSYKSKDSHSQVEKFLRLNRSATPFQPHYYTFEEADAVRRVSSHLAMRVVLETDDAMLVQATIFN